MLWKTGLELVEKGLGGGFVGLLDVEDVQLEAGAAALVDLVLEVAREGVEEGGRAGAEGEREQQRLLFAGFGVLDAEGFHPLDDFRLHIFVEAGFAQRLRPDGDGGVG